MNYHPAHEARALDALAADIATLPAMRCRAPVDGRPCGAEGWHYVRGLGCVCSAHLPTCVVCGAPTTGLRLTVNLPVCIAHSHLPDAVLRAHQEAPC